MKRIAILTAGGDTPALNATIHGAVARSNQLHVEIFGLIKGFNCLFNSRVPHVHLNPLYQAIPELNPIKGGTLIGSSRDYVDPNRKDELDLITSRLNKLTIEGLICIGGYLLPIFTDGIGEDDSEHMRRTLFASGNLAQTYHSINTDVHKRIRYLEGEVA